MRPEDIRKTLSKTRAAGGPLAEKAVEPVTALTTQNVPGILDIADREIALAEAVVNAALRIGGVLVRGGLVPCRSADEAASVLLMARAHGYPMAQAFEAFYVITVGGGQKRIGWYSTAMLGTVRHSGLVSFEFDEGEGYCKVTGKRADTGEEYTASWDMDKARRANLVGKDNWKNYPGNMLRARAISECCRVIAPDIVGNLYTIEELQDLAAETKAEPRETEAVVKVSEMAAEEEEPAQAEAPASKPEPAPEPKAEPAPEAKPEPKQESREEAPATESDAKPKRASTARKRGEPLPDDPEFLGRRRDNLLAAWGGVNVSQAQVESVFGPVKEMDSDALDSIGDIFRQVNEGTVTWQDVLDGAKEVAENGS